MSSQAVAGARRPSRFGITDVTVSKLYVLSSPGGDTTHGAEVTPPLGSVFVVWLEKTDRDKPIPQQDVPMHHQRLLAAQITANALAWLARPPTTRVCSCDPFAPATCFQGAETPARSSFLKSTLFFFFFYSLRSPDCGHWKYISARNG